MRLANPEIDEANSKPVDLNVYRLKRTFCDLVNDMIACYLSLKLPEGRKHYENSIATNLVLAQVFEWYDVAMLIRFEHTRMLNGEDPRIIEFK